MSLIVVTSGCCFRFDCCCGFCFLLAVFCCAAADGAVNASASFTAANLRD